MRSAQAVEERVEALVVAYLEGDDRRVAALLDQVLADKDSAEEAFTVAAGRLLSLLVLLAHPDPRMRLVVDPDAGPFAIFSQVVSSYYDPASGERLERPVHRRR